MALYRWIKTESRWNIIIIIIIIIIILKLTGSILFQYHDV